MYSQLFAYHIALRNRADQSGLLRCEYRNRVHIGMSRFSKGASKGQYYANKQLTFQVLQSIMIKLLVRDKTRTDHLRDVLKNYANAIS